MLVEFVNTGNETMPMKSSFLVFQQAPPWKKLSSILVKDPLREVNRPPEIEGTQQQLPNGTETLLKLF